MIFKQLDEIITGKKTQTRRVVKEDEKLNSYFDDDTNNYVVRGNGKRWDDNPLVWRLEFEAVSHG